MNRLRRATGGLFIATAVLSLCWAGCSPSTSATGSRGGSAGASASAGSGGTIPWPDGGGGTAASGTGGGGGAPLPCDSRFSFSQNPVSAGVAFTTSFTDTPGYSYVDMNVTGPGSPQTTWQGVTGTPHTWSWTVSGHGAGVLDLTFVKDANGTAGTPVASCQIRSNGGGGGGAGGGGGTGGGTGGAPPVNRYGMGYVNEGNAADNDLSAKLTGPGGYVTVIFADIKPGRTNADQSWKDSISDLYSRDLIPVIRMAPPWGDRRVRNMGESPTSYKALAQAYVAVIKDLPKRTGWPMYIEVHNEANLCYEWACDSGSLTAQQMASEYAHMLSDVADAVHGIGDSRIKVLNGALAPGGVNSCDCGTQNGSPGTLSATFLGYMDSAVPGVFDKIDAFASHSYPAKGEGWGFFCSYAEAMPGLTYFKKELAAIGKPNMKVIMTETGWTIDAAPYSWSRDQVADYTVSAYQNVWLTDPNILAVTPFILRDASWDKFAWVQGNGTPYPVYTKVRAYRCSQPGAQNCN